MKETRKLGPSGGKGRLTDITNLAEVSRIIKICIYHSSAIHGFYAVYERDGLRRSKHSVWGSERGTMTMINLAMDECITSLKGSYDSLEGSHNAPLVVTSLTIETNQHTFGPYGEEHEYKFEYPAVIGRIIGFHGRCGEYLQAIGVYVKVSDINATTSIALGRDAATGSSTPVQTTAGGNSSGHVHISSAVNKDMPVSQDTGRPIFGAAITSAGWFSGEPMFPKSAAHTSTGRETGGLTFGSLGVSTGWQTGGPMVTTGIGSAGWNTGARIS